MTIVNHGHDDKPGVRHYKPGDTVTYIATLDSDAPSDIQMTAYFNRDGGPDDSGLTWSVNLSATHVVDSRHVEVSGPLPHAAAGKYNLVRLDVGTGGATKMNNNPDPDHDSSFVVEAQPPKIPNVTDFDPK